MTAGRHIVHESVYDEYVAALADKATNLPTGDPASGAPLGPVIDQGQRDRIHGIVTDSIARGGRLLTGGSSRAVPTTACSTGPRSWPTSGRAMPRSTRKFSVPSRR
jgi:acyl-CoA reductase-like NAD-dependent aldehyde dehydrogenase